MHSLFRQNKFPVLVCREFTSNILERLHELTRETAEMAKKLRISLLFSLFSGNAQSTPIRSAQIADRIRIFKTLY